ncbi:MULTISPECIES: SDR family oxidoreductase [Streptacidiphilus]|uniref:SDR family oxidoreductase n=1 Tax=Streptacidiphilus cavernicola TaxID=3342716 RepID=A0ABV6UMM8_9ACTN|nr:NAD(P)H-binding protein [Streptacidiphilus jeojiense]
MILVTGAAGNAAGQVVAGLLAAGQRVRLLVRGGPRDGRPWPPQGVEVVHGDLRDPAAVDRALDGVDRVLLLIAEDGGAGFAAAPRAAGLERVVLLSSKAVSDQEFVGFDNPLYGKHLRGEEAVLGLGVPWTFLRPGGLASNALRWAASVRREGVVRALFPQLAAPLLHPADLAEVAVAALLDPGHQGRTLTLTGPETITVREQVAVLREVTGRPIRFEEVAEQDAAAVLGPSLPPGFIEVYVPVQKQYLTTTPVVLPTVTEITGKPGRNFRQWAVDHADAFR